VAHQLGVDAITAKRLLHRLRRRYRELLRDEVSRTVEEPADVDDELQYLCAVLAAAE
jgi:RNA polymerase sigma-70 factor (ECF subfamily)